ncbi:MAG: Stp1/IreP family PP2C-type Ser/Thr phosphatase [Planctomycetota bacterium]|nr:MAG: Stp1/IreP family PP2C-type Ser/Thr phosphatase [Planctomycetota bacterium]
MRYAVAGRTDVGQQREHNEDAICVDRELGLYLVCDGMGGAAAGEVASAMCVDIVRRTLAEGAAAIEAWAADPSEPNQREVVELIQRGVDTASAEIHALAEREPEKRGMGTTLAMLLVGRTHAICAHVGDSRVYLIRDGEAHQLTRDHSLVEEMVREGLMSPEEAETSRISNVITRAVGLQPRCVADTLHVELAPGDRFVICSDGLSGYVKGPELPGILEGRSVEEAAEQLVQLANERGGGDNISVIVLAFESVRDPVADDDDPDREPRGPSVSDKLDLLREVPLFQHMSYRERMALLERAEHRTYEPGEQIMAEGERSSELYVLLDGEVSVWRGGQRLSSLGAGAHFGEMCLVEDVPRSATVRAEAPCHTLAFPRDGLYRLMRKRQSLAVKLLWGLCQALAARLRVTSGELSDAYAREQGAGARLFEG